MSVSRLPYWAVLGPALFVAGSFVAGGQAPKDAHAEVLPLLTQYCGPCHGGKDGPNGVTLLDLAKPDSFKASRSVWERVATNLANRHMPPSGSKAPTEAERAKLVSSIRAALGAGGNPGRVTIRRLNRAEYDNTIRDLFGVELRPASDFPSDDVGYGFDNIGDVLTMSPLLMEKYLKSAQKVAESVIYTPGVRKWHVTGAEIDTPDTTATDDGGRMMYTAREVLTEMDLPAEGDYKLKLAAYETPAGPEHAKMAVRCNTQQLLNVEVTGDRRHPQAFEVTFHTAGGRALIGSAFLNDYYRPRTDTSPQEDRNLVLSYFELTGPLPGTTAHLPASHSRIIFVQPTPATRVTCERKILSAFASRAYRRPATEAEVSKLVSIAELAHQNGDPFERGIQLGITAALCSPNFLFRVEKPSNDFLGSYELASRLSYFLWSSMPDAELFSLAAKGQLQNSQVLEGQVRRMLLDPKAEALGENFAAQWLQTRKLAVVEPDRRLFPNYTPELGRSMATETKMFFNDVVQKDRSVLDFIDGRYTFVNGPLAKLYGMGPAGNGFVRRELPPERAGILTQGSVLVVTSNPTRTSPVKRGKWILENILGTPPPPPPPGVGVLKEDQQSLDAASLKERLEQHRKDPMCASCHNQMDGLGFALENFDPIGAWRTKDGHFDIDPSGTLPDGSKFAGPAELRAVLVKKRDQFVRCLSEKLLTFALGRGVESFDTPTVDKITKAVSDGQYKFSALVTAIVESDAFRRNRPESK